jgi:hypothetical protein
MVQNGRPVMQKAMDTLRRMDLGEERIRRISRRSLPFFVRVADYSQVRDGHLGLRQLFPCVWSYAGKDQGRAAQPAGA